MFALSWLSFWISLLLTFTCLEDVVTTFIFRGCIQNKKLSSLRFRLWWKNLADGKRIWSFAQSPKTNQFLASWPPCGTHNDLHDGRVDDLQYDLHESHALGCPKLKGALFSESRLHCENLFRHADASSRTLKARLQLSSTITDSLSYMFCQVELYLLSLDDWSTTNPNLRDSLLSVFSHRLWWRERTW